MKKKLIIVLGLCLWIGCFTVVFAQAPENFTACVDGMAGGYPCEGLDLLAQIPLNQFSLNPNEASDIWGHVDLNNNREYAIITVYNGTAIFDVTDPLNPVEVASVPGLGSIWRDVKVYQFYDYDKNRWQAYAYVVTEAPSQGLQIIDLNDLPNSAFLAATYLGFSRAHNIYIAEVDYQTNTANNPLNVGLNVQANAPIISPGERLDYNITLSGPSVQAYILGSNLDNGAFRILDLANPLDPVEISSPVSAGYVHDANSLIISDSRVESCQPGHNPCELFVEYKGNSLAIWDVTDKAAPFKIKSLDYDNFGYIHSGWASEDKQFLFIQDEFDEQLSGVNTTLRTLDISDLENPFVSHIWRGPSPAIDHNGFVKGNRYYMSNYERGLTILDISNANDPQAIAYFDTFPASDRSSYEGAWGVYPYLPSGTILVSDINRGLFLLKEHTFTGTLQGTVLPPETISVDILNPLPANVSYVPNSASHNGILSPNLPGSASLAMGVYWPDLSIFSTSIITRRFSVTVSETAPIGQPISNTTYLSGHGISAFASVEVMVVATRYKVYMPLLLK